MHFLISEMSTKGYDSSGDSDVSKYASWSDFDDEKKKNSNDKKRRVTKYTSLSAHSSSCESGWCNPINNPSVCRMRIQDYAVVCESL